MGRQITNRLKNASVRSTDNGSGGHKWYRLRDENRRKSSRKTSRRSSHTHIHIYTPCDMTHDYMMHVYMYACIQVCMYVLLLITPCIKGSNPARPTFWVGYYYIFTYIHITYYNTYILYVCITIYTYCICIIWFFSIEDWVQSCRSLRPLSSQQQLQQSVQILYVLCDSSLYSLSVQVFPNDKYVSHVKFCWVFNSQWCILVPGSWKLLELM